MNTVQQTLKQELVFSGIGVHSGVFSTVRLVPAPADTGIVFRHEKFPNDPLYVGKVIPEVAMHATVIRHAHWMISTIEHLMAALMMMDVDNVIIIVDGVEIPILDGSAFPFVQGIMHIGLLSQGQSKKFLTPARVLTFEHEDRFLQISPEKSREQRTLFIDYTAEFDNHTKNSAQLSGVVSQDFFEREIAPARTFGYVGQLPFLRKHGLAQGTSLGNTVVAGADGYINDVRYQDEFVRHKFLDLIGDLSLLGRPLVGSICAKKTGHSFNRLVIQHYCEHPEEWLTI
ncbi:UDP-3-O-acyl-N-acetylglucosamine deacetylase [Candidatus Babeliales bacterium]|nr:UDP-3-O-acyl-N-acetylglucosamine deacetylase [Candidatus Babeliales bacterium]